MNENKINITKKIVQLGVALWEQEVQEGIQTSEIQEKLHQGMSNMTEARELVLEMTPYQKSLLLFMTTNMLALLATCMEDEKSSAPVVAASIIKATDEMLKRDLESGKLRMPMTFPDLIGMAVMHPKTKED